VRAQCSRLVKGVRIAATSSYLPGPARSQDELRAFLRRYPHGLTPDLQERLLRETGIETRHFAISFEDESRRENNTTMASAAGRAALERAGWFPDDVELLVVTDVVPDQLMPPTSTLVQQALGIRRCAELEISCNCSAPFKGLQAAADAIRLGRVRRALVCCSQYGSVLARPPWTNPERMAPHHGALLWIVSDGAAAVALEASDNGCDLEVWTQASGLGLKPGMSLALGSAYPDLVGGFERGDHHIRQDDRYVLRQGVTTAVEGLGRALEALHIDGRSIDHFMPTVSSLQVERTLKTLFAQHHGVPAASWRTSFTRVGYVGGVGFLLVLDELARTGVLEAGERVVGFAMESSKWISAAATLRWEDSCG